ncbi:MAG: SigE family RNA polymerase sigma factor [Actinomycetes bacterium]
MAERELSADEELSALYTAHYRSLVRTAWFLVHDAPLAEEIVQDAFVAMHQGWRRLRDRDRALAYLRQSVVNGVRSSLRRGQTASKYAPVIALDDSPGAGGARDVADDVADRQRLVLALRQLTARQREALVLRYYGDLSEQEIADTMGVTPGAVKTHASRGLAALRVLLEQS